MTESPRNEETKNEAVSNAQTPSEHAPGYTEYTYETAGITELEGNVPLWLWVVVVSLLVWGAYYLVTYWSAPIAST